MSHIHYIEFEVVATFSKQKRSINSGLQWQKDTSHEDIFRKQDSEIAEYGPLDGIYTVQGFSICSVGLKRRPASLIGQADMAGTLILSHVLE